MNHRAVQDPEVSVRIMDEDARAPRGPKYGLVGNNVGITDCAVPRIRDRAEIRVVINGYRRIIRPERFQRA